jgi:hypothetical protein
MEIMETYGSKIFGQPYNSQFQTRAVEEVTASMRNMSLQEHGANNCVQIDLVQLIRHEISELGIDLDLYFYGETQDYPNAYNEVELHALTSYSDAIKFLFGSHGFQQNLKAAIRELKISSQLGNPTAGAMLEAMKMELGDELKYNDNALKLWNSANELGIEIARNFRCLEQASMTYGNQIETHNYFEDDNFNENLNAYSSSEDDLFY